MDSVSNFVETNKNLQIWVSILFIALLIGGWFYPPLGYFMVICMFGAMGVGIVKGRYWCDWMCPRGSFWDTILKRFSFRKEVPGFFRHPAFRLGWLVLLMTMLAIQLPPVWGDFYLMGKPFVKLLMVTTVVGLIFGVIYQERIWCMFCPMGTTANVLGKGKHSLLVNDSCTNCGLCSKVCRMQIKPGSYRAEGMVNHGDCLKCAYCIEVCKQQALNFEQATKGKRTGTIEA